MRRFEEVGEKFRKFPDVPTQLPERSTAGSAGYDFKSKEDYVLRVGDSHVFWTDCKCKMFFDNFLAVYARSGLGCKRGITPRNNVGIIDSDYYGNSDNDGNIGICLVNNGYEDLHVKVGDRIAQGIIGRYYITDDDKFASNNEKAVERTGGFGSSGK